MQTVSTNQTQIANLSDKHCIFQCGDSVFSLPATSVREVTMLPPIVRVPLSHPSLAGIGNIRSEFLPVLDLEPFVGNQARLDQCGNQLLVIESPLGGWAIAIDKVIAIDVIETHVDACARSEHSTSVLFGTASHANHVISVLDVNELQRIAQKALESRWNEIRPIRSTEPNPSTEVAEWHNA